MLTRKFCFHCGGALAQDAGDMECNSCGAVYSNILLSETEFADNGHNILEIGFTADIMVKTPVIPDLPIEAPEPLALTSTPRVAEATA